MWWEERTILVGLSWHMVRECGGGGGVRVFQPAEGFEWHSNPNAWCNYCSAAVIICGDEGSKHHVKRVTAIALHDGAVDEKPARQVRDVGDGVAVLRLRRIPSPWPPAPRCRRALQARASHAGSGGTGAGDAATRAHANAGEARAVANLLFGHTRMTLTNAACDDCRSSLLTLVCVMNLNDISFVVKRFRFVLLVMSILDVLWLMIDTCMSHELCLDK